MAIQIARTAAQTTVGIDCAAAFARIAALRYDALTGRTELSVNVYGSQDAYRAGHSPVGGGVYAAKFYSVELVADFAAGMPVDPAVDALPAISAPVLTAAYAFLLTLPDFAGGTQV